MSRVAPLRLVRAAMVGLAFAVPVALPALGCGGATRAPTSATASDAVVRLVGGPSDAAVWVNGRFVADLATLRRGLALAAGVHRIEIRHDGYFAAYLELELASRERRDIQVVMAPKLD